jgi:hypothetical protein
VGGGSGAGGVGGHDARRPGAPDVPGAPKAHGAAASAGRAREPLPRRPSHLPHGGPDSRSSRALRRAQGERVCSALGKMKTIALLVRPPGRPERADGEGRRPSAERQQQGYDEGSEHGQTSRMALEVHDPTVEAPPASGCGRLTGVRSVRADGAGGVTRRKEVRWESLEPMEAARSAPPVVDGSAGPGPAAARHAGPATRSRAPTSARSAGRAPRRRTRPDGCRLDSGLATSPTHRAR